MVVLILYSFAFISVFYLLIKYNNEHKRLNKAKELKNKALKDLKVKEIEKETEEISNKLKEN